mmetsp:Transcript_14614/g.39110  ORF Transcript_14614/g.39110 Transcript_14614/m.39110 type:complete len:220 (-) Transcript_14614:1803-2462(-)
MRLDVSMYNAVRMELAETKHYFPQRVLSGTWHVTAHVDIGRRLFAHCRWHACRHALGERLVAQFKSKVNELRIFLHREIAHNVLTCVLQLNQHRYLLSGGTKELAQQTFHCNWPAFWEQPSFEYHSAVTAVTQHARRVLNSPDHCARASVRDALGIPRCGSDFVERAHNCTTFIGFNVVCRVERGTSAARHLRLVRAALLQRRRRDVRLLKSIQLGVAC